MLPPADTSPTSHPGAFIFLLILAGYVGLLPHSASSSIPPQLQPSDKFLHVVTFFALSLTFYWVIDTSRRRVLHLSLLVCTLILGIGSEILQGILPNDRAFDPFDILANVVGSLGAIGLCSWYHRRMLERRRLARFGALAGDDHGNNNDIELGIGADAHGQGDSHENSELGPQETGVLTLEQQVDRWDENAVDKYDMEEDAEDAGALRNTIPDRDQGSSPAVAHPDGINDGGRKKRSD